MRRLVDDPLARALRLLEVRPWQLLAAVAAGAGALGSAVALAAVSAWLIARASQMPPVLHLTIAAVAVRTFGVSRGVLRYLERLVSHDLALRGMTTLRTRLYERLAAGDAARLLGLRRGDLLARVGADVDAVGDLVVRGVLPALASGAVGIGTVVLLAALLPSAGAVVAGALLLAGVVAPWWVARSAREVEHRTARARADMSATVLTALDGAGELAVARRTAAVLDELAAAERELARTTDLAARPTARAAALQHLATGGAVVAALLLGGPAVATGTLSHLALAVVVLTPLVLLEVTGALPAAAAQVWRSRGAAARVLELLDTAAAPPAGRAGDRPGAAGADRGSAGDEARPSTAALVASRLVCARDAGSATVGPLDLHLVAGRSVAVVGPNGVGKTTLLLTLAGLLPAAGGTVTVGGTAPHRLARAEAARRVSYTPEDARVFGTTLLENLRVARGDVTADEAVEALEGVGLGPWLADLPDGLDTVLGPDARGVSGGERRRLLVARALLSRAPVLLLDEPTEHVDADGTALQRTLLDGTLAGGRSVVVVTHRDAGLEAADEVILLGADGTVQARGSADEVVTAARRTGRRTPASPTDEGP